MNNSLGIFSVHTLSIDSDGNYVDSKTGENKNAIAKTYSLMKFGSAADIDFAANEIYQKFMIDFPEFESFFQERRNRNEFIAVTAPGFRNVESASNLLIDKAIKKINVFLSHKNLPTIIVMKLPRLESNKANYATLSSEERHSLPPTTDQILPGQEFFRFPIHFIFGDDIKITGATAKGAKIATEKHNALSFSEIYWVSLDPELTARFPGVEDKINQAQVKNELNQDIEYILEQDAFQPVQRLIRLILNETNRSVLTTFLKTVPDNSLSKLYISAHNNDYPKNDLYKESVVILNNEMKIRNLVNTEGLLL
ncbi:TPA: hypothetical protein DIU27_05710 [Candidatus Collierbacteria bacterium]|uniref:Uncharacterized protein n=1 Tax=Candidatus Collierbacteria bacterium GW2011_GWB2_44_22 TaxID=1618387 RepID=A0A0G1K753_9BACT|nr:MAG: hypothetical protein UW31_C0015G0010 [Candidatus Collierbacteria bacterium GW2011_GWA2_44_13]KKT48954.1 MAG: hypothetical protein UW42_C0043G0005 [Candidatus Collierbacteria bacterium GW2011_GWB1_44_197]KKT52132.1 MAG: hypothetical protein UW44_C0004G0037 [Candidatus Collierbacteria bacterium GW2011_GWB2_44_22]KKT61782.1 MAG: hypothetical protein UW56_C0018G0012 [Candidatus Collierbacteria bacterium GW2011_GWD1_44_27]KKT65704.1 MAG: hypothetical protein UW58_C0022G0010 [Candidatus Colli